MLKCKFKIDLTKFINTKIEVQYKAYGKQKKALVIYS